MEQMDINLNVKENVAVNTRALSSPLDVDVGSDDGPTTSLLCQNGK